jgi:hypothetical protein
MAGALLSPVVELDLQVRDGIATCASALFRKYLLM